MPRSKDYFFGVLIFVGVFSFGGFTGLSNTPTGISKYSNTPSGEFRSGIAFFVLALGANVIVLASTGDDFGHSHSQISSGTSIVGRVCFLSGWSLLYSSVTVFSWLRVVCSIAFKGRGAMSFSWPNHRLVSKLNCRGVFP
jgi:hypothetical protein